MSTKNIKWIKIIVNKDFLVTYMLIILKSVNKIHTNKFLNCDMFLTAISAGVSDYIISLSHVIPDKI